MIRSPRMLACLVLLGAIATSHSQAQSLSQADLARILTPTDELQGQFEQDKYLTILPRPLHSSGQFHYQRQQGLEWIIEQPIASKVMISEHGISQTQGGEVVWQSDANSAQTATVANLLAAIFAGDLATLQATFAITGTQVSETNGWDLQLTPKSDVLMSFFSRIDMTGTMTGTTHLQGLTLHEPKGDRTEIRLEVSGDASAAE